MDEPDTIDPLSLPASEESDDSIVTVDIALTADERADFLFDAFLRVASPADLILAYQQASAFVHDLEERRKTENARLASIAKAWERRRKELAPKLLEALPPGKGDKAHGTAKTLLGSTWAVAKPEWSARITREDEAIKELAELLRARGEEPYWEDPVFRSNELVEMHPVLGQAGRDTLKAHAVALMRDNGEVVPWAEVSPPGYTIATRLVAARKQQAITGMTAHILESVRRVREAAMLDSEIPYHGKADFEKPDWMR